MVGTPSQYRWTKGAYQSRPCGKAHISAHSPAGAKKIHSRDGQDYATLPSGKCTEVNAKSNGLKLHDQSSTGALALPTWNGLKARFWTSSWLHGNTPAALYPSLFKHSRRKSRSVAEALQADKWIRDIACDLSSTVLAEYFQLWTAIHNLQLNLDTPEPDTIKWRFAADGTYSAKSAYDMQFMGTVSSDTQTIIWTIWAPPRIKFFLWLMLQNRIWTADRLQQRHWPNEYFCQLCLRNLETTDHLFTECPYARELWDKVIQRINQPTLLSLTRNENLSVSQWYRDLLPHGFDKSKASGTRSIAMLTIWTLWNERNRRVFRRGERTTTQLLHEIRDEARTWTLAGAKNIKELSVFPDGQ